MSTLWATKLRIALGTVLASLALGAGPGTMAAWGSQPNVILILTDDLGWSDIACNGGDLVETPHIDELAKSGVRFTHAYAPSPVCSPTRAAILTGKAPARLHITVWSEAAGHGPEDRKLIEGQSLANLPRSETTLAASLQRAGYLTALVGKWHLGDADHAPEAHGFDVNIGGTHWGAPNTFFWPYRGEGRFGDFRYIPHLEFGKTGEYLTDRLTQEAIRVIDHAKQRPFLLCLAHHAPHTPIEAKTEDVDYFRRKLTPALRHQNPVYAAMIKSIDDSVASIVKHLNQQGLAGNTIIIFASDNGGYIGVDRKSGQDVPVTNNAPLRSGKGSCYEGGLRVPLIVSWPGITPAASVCDEPVVLTDLFYTLVEATSCGSRAAASTADGVDLTSLLRNPSGALDRDALFFHFPHYYDTTTPVSAVRCRDWKLLEFFEDDRAELYNLACDPGERVNLAEQRPEKASELRQLLGAWRDSVNASRPRQNPLVRGKASLPASRRQ